MKPEEMFVVIGALALMGFSIYSLSKNNKVDYLSGIEDPRDVDQKVLPPLKHSVSVDENMDMMSLENANLYDEFLHVGRTGSCDLAVAMTQKNNFRQYSLGKNDFLIRLGLETARRYSNLQIVNGFIGGYEPDIINAFNVIKTEKCAPLLNRTFLENYHSVPYEYGTTRAISDVLALYRDRQLNNYSI